MLLREDTIVAPATAAGRSAIAIVRVSGGQSRAFLERIARRPPVNAAAPRLTTLIDPRDGTELDQVLATWYRAPHSYTGEDLVEFSCHGSPAVVTALVDALVWLGARVASAGEFTQRALLRGKLDIVQAEAIGQLIDAPTHAARRVALQQLRGQLSTHLTALRNDLLELEALLAYDIDFPEEDDGPVPPGRILDAATRVLGRLDAMRDTFPLGDAMITGARVVIAGPPNVGKSSLFNALLGERRAIVTEVPGTTRDSLEALLDIGPWSIRLVDTAGLRETDDVVEKLGVEVSLEQVARAHVLLVCADTAPGLDATVEALSGRTDAAILRALTKQDDGPAEVTSDLAVSALTRHGIGELLDRLRNTLSLRLPSASTDTPVVTLTRHREGLNTAAAELRQFREHWKSGALPAPVVATHVRAACQAIDDLLGGVDIEDILERVFASFCVGK